MPVRSLTSAVFKWPDRDAVLSAAREWAQALRRRDASVEQVACVGSYARGDWGVGNDLDFLVEFLPLQAGEHFDAYFGLLEALGDLFQRPVDLVMTRAIKNPYFLKAVNQTRVVFYAA